MSDLRERAREIARKEGMGSPVLAAAILAALELTRRSALEEAAQYAETRFIDPSWKHASKILATELRALIPSDRQSTGRGK